MNKLYTLAFSILAILIFVASCKQDKPTEIESNTFLNLHDSVQYVGMQQCRSCHSDIYNSYIHTGMGQSFDEASPQKSKATFGEHALVYDEQLDFYYKPYFQDSSLYIMEFRLKSKDTIHKRIEKVDYIIGSGHHTNSHLINTNGYIHQAPITYYTQDKKWDLAPGFEDGLSKRFSRMIAQECLTCHNHLPQAAPGATNKFLDMPLGIECERCHGPGEIHVREKLAGNIVDISKQTDYSIVNPAKLSVERQMDLCQRCHLQGVAVLNAGKSFYDFKPGMRLTDIMNVYLPRFTNSDERFIMASQADRLRLSNCYTVSKELSCITCHNPHHDVHSTKKNNYNTACISCHNPKTNKSKFLDCSIPSQDRELKQNNCVACHMPSSGSIDIPHVNITDHYISRTNIGTQDSISDSQKEEVAQFLGLQSLLLTQPSALDMAKGYLALYDKFMKDPLVLDSIKYYLDRIESNNSEKQAVAVHYLFTKGDYNGILNLANTLQASQVDDAWTAYRIGEAYLKTGNLAVAQTYLEKAVVELPYHLDFQEKLGVVYAQLQSYKKAQKTFEFILSENPKRKVALSNMGFMQALQGKFPQAMRLYDQALAIDPDYKTALLNKTGLLLQLNKKAEAKMVLEHLLDKHPDHQRAKQLLEQL
ncbi:MAG: tetratricopeptide repeat protein [Aureispira sp.]|nr:tetratricopeptide repeat protein [Aureispira sp.]